MFRDIESRAFVIQTDAKRVLARNTTWNYAGFALNLVTNFVMFPYVVSHIGDAAAGVWLLLGSVTGYMGLLELGIVPSLTQSVAASLARGGRQSVSRAVSSAQAVLVGLAGLALPLLPVAAWLVRALGIPDSLQADALLAFRITILGFAARMPLAAFQGTLLGYQRQDRCNQLWMAIGFAKALGAVVVLGSGQGLVALVSIEMAIHLLAGVLQIRWVFAENPSLELSLRLVNREDIARLLSFGSAILAVRICSLIIEQTDRLVVAAFLTVSMVTHYAAAWKVYMLSYALTTTLVQAVAPMAADLYGRQDFNGLKRLFMQSTKYTAALAWPLVFTFAFSGGFLLRVWMGPRFVSALAVVQVLLVGFIVTAHNHAGYSALIGMRRVGPTVGRYFAPQAVLNLMLSIWLVKRLGNVGVAVGTMVPAVGLEYLFFRFVLSELGVEWREFLKSAVAPAAVPALISYLPLVLVYTRVDVTSPLLPIMASASSLLYAVLFWQGLDREGRRAVVGHLPPMFRRRAESLLSVRALWTEVDHQL